MKLEAKQRLLASRPFKKGDRVVIKKQWQDKGDNDYDWLCVDDEEKGRVTISVTKSALRITPTHVVSTDMIEHIS
jgi:hypothetical protein